MSQDELEQLREDKVRLTEALVRLREERGKWMAQPRVAPKPASAELDLRALQAKLKKLEDFSDEQAADLKAAVEERDAANEAAAIHSRSNDELKAMTQQRIDALEKVNAALRKLQNDVKKVTKTRDGWHARCKELIAREPSEEQRQMMILAFAKLSIERPGWDMTLNELALNWDNGDKRAEMYDQFREMNKSALTPEQWGTLLRACIKLRRALDGHDPKAVIDGEKQIADAQKEILEALPEESDG